jgi:hypothetical protein
MSHLSIGASESVCQIRPWDVLVKMMSCSRLSRQRQKGKAASSLEVLRPGIAGSWVVVFPWCFVRLLEKGERRLSFGLSEFRDVRRGWFWILVELLARVRCIDPGWKLIKAAVRSWELRDCSKGHRSGFSFFQSVRRLLCQCVDKPNVRRGDSARRKRLREQRDCITRFDSIPASAPREHILATNQTRVSANDSVFAIYCVSLPATVITSLLQLPWSAAASTATKLIHIVNDIFLKK